MELDPTGSDGVLIKKGAGLYYARGVISTSASSATRSIYLQMQPLSIYPTYGTALNDMSARDDSLLHTSGGRLVYDCYFTIDNTDYTSDPWKIVVVGTNSSGSSYSISASKSGLTIVRVSA